jgi:hypothetical protein
MLVKHTTCEHSKKVTEVSHIIANSVCPCCATCDSFQLSLGAGPHAARLGCGTCGMGLRWFLQARAVQGGAR